MLQLSLYSDLLAKIQGTLPEFLWVVPPGEGYAGEKYPVMEYAAYYRHVKDKLVRAIGGGPPRKVVPTPETYPEPVEHCNVCRWFRECDTKRRADDHLSLVAGVLRQQPGQFGNRDGGTMWEISGLALPLNGKPQ